VVLIDPCPLTRECIRQMLAIKAPDFSVQASEAFTVADDPDLILLNLQSASVSNPAVVAQLEQIQKHHGTVPVVVMSTVDEPNVIHASLCRFNLRGYFPASYSAAIMIAALRLVIVGGTFVPSCVLDNRKPVIEDRPPVKPDMPIIVLGDFSSREQQVFHLLREGKPNKIIAFELQISEETVKVHIRNMMKKLKLTNRTQIAVSMSGGIPLTLNG